MRTSAPSPAMTTTPVLAGVALHEIAEARAEVAVAHIGSQRTVQRAALCAVEHTRAVIAGLPARARRTAASPRAHPAPAAPAAPAPSRVRRDSHGRRRPCSTSPGTACMPHAPPCRRTHPAQAAAATPTLGVLHRAHGTQRCNQMPAQPPHPLGRCRHQSPLVQRHHHRLVATCPPSPASTLKYCMAMGGSAPRSRVASCLATGKDNAVPIPIILDCDPGTDDAFALLLALASPEIELLAVTVAGGNVGLDRTLPNALALTALARLECPGLRRGRPAAAGQLRQRATRARHRWPRRHRTAARRRAGCRPCRRRHPQHPARRHAAGDAGRHRAGHQSCPGTDDRAGAGRERRTDRADDRRLGRGQCDACRGIQRIQ